MLIQEPKTEIRKKYQSNADKWSDSFNKILKEVESLNTSGFNSKRKIESKLVKIDHLIANSCK